MLLLCSCWTYVFHVSLQCQGVSGIIIVTMVTSFMLVYNSSSGNRSSSSASSLSPHRLDGPVPSMEKPERVPTSTLEGYTGVMDHKVNMHHLCVGRRSLSLYNVIDNDGSGSSFETFKYWCFRLCPNYCIMSNCSKKLPRRPKVRGMISKKNKIFPTYNERKYVGKWRLKHSPTTTETSRVFIQKEWQCLGVRGQVLVSVLGLCVARWGGFRDIALLADFGRS